MSPPSAMTLPFTVFGLALLLSLTATSAAMVWPEKEWATASPDSQGIRPEACDRAAEYALRYGGGSGCIIRHGFLVMEWGSRTALADIKSATKGAFGATLLGLAVDDGKVKLDDRADRYVPEIGTEEPGNAATGWLSEITVRQLASMSAGFDDGRPPKLVYRPGTGGIYSNDTANMLAELLTLRYNEDLSALLKRRVMDPLGVPPDEWRWRDNAYRAKMIGGLPSREFASGITITPRALARIGYLYLCGGRWKDRQILSESYVREATKAVPRPFCPFYGFYWGSNSDNAFPELPRDAFWALGLGDSFVLACPSLDVVMVRLGTGSKASELPGGDEDGQWGQRVAHLFKFVVEGIKSPYPPSPVIETVTWAPASSIMRKAQDSDTWPLTWADDDALYTAYGDGYGFEPKIDEKLSLGLAKVTGSPPDITGTNLRSATLERRGGGKDGEKASGILSVDGVLYLWVRNAGNSRLAWSKDHGATWEWSDWRFTSGFGCPTFLNFGKDYAGARDGYVYVYSPDSDTAYDPADRMVMARVPKDRITRRDAYEFFAGLSPDGTPRWTNDLEKRGAVFVHPGRCYRSGITYDAGLKRYLWCQILPGKDDMRFKGGFGIYDAPEPWGPWTTVYSTEEWDVGPGESSSLPTKWMSEDGTRLHLVFSGDDYFSVRALTLGVRPGKE